MFGLLPFLPMLLFVALYVGSGIYFSLTGIDHAFYQVSATTAIIPALIVAWIIHKGPMHKRMTAFIEGVRHPDIITMCILFFLAGAFGKVTAEIGSVSALVNLATACIPSHLLIIGIFIACAIISTAIGTSMGTIATCAPLAAALAQQGAFGMPFAMATVVGGAMFGDSLSMISDTTIAAVLSQNANMQKKFKINAVVALIAAVITVVLLFFLSSGTSHVAVQEISYVLIIPYALLIGLAASGHNPFVVLIVSLISAWLVGWYHHDYSLLACGKAIDQGFISMHNIALLSLLVGGLSGLCSDALMSIHSSLQRVMGSVKNKKVGQFLIGGLVMLCDLLIANNTVAIVFSGGIAKEIAQRFKIPSHYTAAWLDVFSCVTQGLIPYGAQILLASSIGGISPLSIVPKVYYCYVLFAVATVYIIREKHLSA